MNPLILLKVGKILPFLQAIPKKLLVYLIIAIVCWIAWEWNEHKAYKEGYRTAQEEYIEVSQKLLQADLRKAMEDLRIATEERDKRQQRAKELASELDQIKLRSKEFKDEIDRLKAANKDRECFVIDDEYYRLFRSLLEQK